MTDDTASARPEAHYEGSSRAQRVRIVPDTKLPHDLRIVIGSGIDAKPDHQTADKLAQALTPSSPLLGEGLVVVPLDDDARPFADSLLPDKMIEAGEEALDRVQHDLANYVSGETIDWDNGMAAVAVYRAMIAAAPATAPPPLREETQELRKALPVAMWRCVNCKAAMPGRADGACPERCPECRGSQFAEIANPPPPTDDVRALEARISNAARALLRRLRDTNAIAVVGYRHAIDPYLRALEGAVEGAPVSSFELISLLDEPRIAAAVNEKGRHTPSEIAALSAQSPPPPSSGQVESERTVKNLASRTDVGLPPSSGQGMLATIRDLLTRFHDYHQGHVDRAEAHGDAAHSYDQAAEAAHEALEALGSLGPEHDAAFAPPSSGEAEAVAREDR